MNSLGLVVLFVSIAFGLLVLRDFINILSMLAISRLLVWSCKEVWFDSSFVLVLDPEIKGFHIVCVGFHLNLSYLSCLVFVSSLFQVLGFVLGCS